MSIYHVDEFIKRQNSAADILTFGSEATAFNRTSQIPKTDIEINIFC